MTQSGHRREKRKVEIIPLLAPMCGAQIDPLLGVSFDPSAKKAVIGKSYWMRAVGIVNANSKSRLKGAVDISCGQECPIAQGYNNRSY
jgi:hypothetical protein